MVGISELSKEVSKKTGQTQKVAREVIKGIGIETMQDIMLYAFNRKVFVVDKYTERFFSRLGIIEPGMNNAYSMGVEIQRNMDLEDLKNFHGEIVEPIKTRESVMLTFGTSNTIGMISNAKEITRSSLQFSLTGLLE